MLRFRVTGSAWRPTLRLEGLASALLQGDRGSTAVVSILSRPYHSITEGAERRSLVDTAALETVAEEGGARGRPAVGRVASTASWPRPL